LSSTTLYKLSAKINSHYGENIRAYAYMYIDALYTYMCAIYIHVGYICSINAYISE